MNTVNLSIAKDSLLGNTVILETTGSTQDYAKALLAERPDDTELDGLGIVALNQTAGRGRRGRTFLSPTGGLYLSVILRPESAFPPGLLTTAAAASMCRALEAFAPDHAYEIKWVNDILVGGRKLCGILTEGIFGASRPAYILGVGLNIFTPKGGFEPPIDQIACALFDEPAPPLSATELSEAHRAVLSLFYRELGTLLPEVFAGNAPHYDEYSRRCKVVGQAVSYTDGDETHHARVLALNRDFSLELAESAQQITRACGEISIRKDQSLE